MGNACRKVLFPFPSLYFLGLFQLSHSLPRCLFLIQLQHTGFAATAAVEHAARNFETGSNLLLAPCGQDPQKDHECKMYGEYGFKGKTGRIESYVEGSM